MRWRQHRHVATPEKHFRVAIILAGRDYFNSYYPRSYLLSLSQADLMVLLTAFRLNHAPLSAEVLTTEEAAIAEVDSGQVAIRSQ